MTFFTSAFWDGYIGAITLASIVACAVFLKVQSVRRTAKGETHGHVWDEDLTEYNNPMPRWWAWLFYITVAFSLGYLAFFPGLGSYQGSLGWTQLTQLEDETRAAEARFGPIYDQFAAQEVTALAKNPQALATGQKLFLNHCAQCHASDGKGSTEFPDLTDREWLWGGTPEAIRTSITEGRRTVMPPMGAAVGADEDVRNVAHYVLQIAGRTHDSLRAYSGKQKFQQVCTACHGPEGKGNQQLGAPNLTSEVALHGMGESGITAQVMKGSARTMPAHKDILSPAKLHLLTAYVYSLSLEKR